MFDGPNRVGWPVLILLVLSSGYFIVRGPMRALDQTVDLPTFYAATCAWVNGQNPYDQPTTQRIYQQAGGGERVVAICMNPPMFFPLLAPLAAFNYPAAQWVMVGINLISLLVAGWTFGHVAGLLNQPRTCWLWWAALLALAPVHTTISQGQHGLMVIALLGLALCADVSGRDLLVGICLAIAAALKPQMVLLFGFYYLFRGRWRVCAAGALGSSVLLVVGICRMEMVRIDWWPSMWANLDAFANATVTTQTGAGTANYAILGNGRFIMLDIETLIQYVTSESVVIKALRLIFGSIVLGLTLYTARRRPKSTMELLPTYALLAVGCVLTFYNRFYAGTALIMVIGLGMYLIRMKRPRLGWIILGLVGPFVVPGVAILLKLESGALAQSTLVQTWIWLKVLLPHQVLILLCQLALIAMLAWQWKRGPVLER